MTRIAGWGLLAGALLLVPFGAAAQVPDLCVAGSGDFDRDGFGDAQECNGITLLPGLRLAETGATVLPECAPGVPPSTCVDPATSDLFVIFDRSTGQSPLPPDALAVFAKLGITLHTLVRTDTGTSRQVSALSSQNAVQIATNGDTTDNVNGRANWGTPNNLDGAIVFTNRIASFVNGLCPAGTTCLTHTGLQRGASAITPVLTRWVSDHEAGHTVALSGQFNKRYGGYHEPSGSLTVMEETPKVVDKRGTVTFFIGDAFSSASAADVTLSGRK